VVTAAGVLKQQDSIYYFLGDDNSVYHHAVRRSEEPQPLQPSDELLQQLVIDSWPHECEVPLVELSPHVALEGDLTSPSFDASAESNLVYVGYGASTEEESSLVLESCAAVVADVLSDAAMSGEVDLMQEEALEGLCELVDPFVQEFGPEGAEDGVLVDEAHALFCDLIEEPCQAHVEKELVSGDEMDRLDAANVDAVCLFMEGKNCRAEEDPECQTLIQSLEVDTKEKKKWLKRFQIPAARSVRMEGMPGLEVPSPSGAPSLSRRERVERYLRKRRERRGRSSYSMPSSRQKSAFRRPRVNGRFTDAKEFICIDSLSS